MIDVKIDVREDVGRVSPMGVFASHIEKDLLMSFARRVQRDTDSLPQFIPSSERIAGEQRDRCDAFGTRHSRRRVHARATLVPRSRKRTVRGSHLTSREMHD